MELCPPPDMNHDQASSLFVSNQVKHVLDNNYFGIIFLLWLSEKGAFHQYLSILLFHSGLCTEQLISLRSLAAKIA